jgi:hypothetical protein
MHANKTGEQQTRFRSPYTGCQFASNSLVVTADSLRGGGTGKSVMVAEAETRQVCDGPVDHPCGLVQTSIY